MRNQIEMFEYKDQKEQETSWILDGNKGVKQLLIVDDEAKIREIYQNIFKMMGYKVIATANTSDASIVLASEDIDIVILDINLQDHSRGALYKLIRTFCKRTRVVVSSVYPVQDQMEKFENADGYFDKSDDNDVLINMVSSLA